MPAALTPGQLPSDKLHRPEQFKHRRTTTEVERCKRGERTDIKVSEWGKYGYAWKPEVLSRNIKYDSQTVPIPRIRHEDITPDEFYQRFACANIPVIIEGGCKHWPAMEEWSVERLEERYRHISFKVGEDNKRKKLRMKMKYFLDYMRAQQDDNPLYLFEATFHDNTTMSQMLDDFQVPDIFPHDWLNLMNRDSRPPYRWFCIGPKRSGTTVHTDPLGTSAWNAVTHGCKRWVLFEPQTSKRIAKGKGLRHKGEDDEAVMYFDFLLPRLKQANPEQRVYEGLQDSGDVIFVPGGWWHGVLNIEDCIAVTQNYCGPDNFDVVWTETRRDREKLAHLWLRNMRRFAPQLHERALALNRRDGFRMRHERPPGDHLEDASSSTSDSSDSSSDEVVDLSPSGLAKLVHPDVCLRAAGNARLCGMKAGRRQRQALDLSLSPARKRPHLGNC